MELAEQGVNGKSVGASGLAGPFLVCSLFGLRNRGRNCIPLHFSLADCQKYGELRLPNHRFPEVNGMTRSSNG